MGHIIPFGEYAMRKKGQNYGMACLCYSCGAHIKNGDTYFTGSVDRISDKFIRHYCWVCYDELSHEVDNP